MPKAHDHKAMYQRIGMCEFPSVNPFTQRIKETRSRAAGSRPRDARAHNFFYEIDGTRTRESQRALPLVPIPALPKT
jgi:hypothetical protein